jgi:DNA polymerase III subunit epsilon
VTLKHVNKVLLLDVESTGVDPSINQCIEIAVCLFDVKLASPITSYANIMYAPSNDAFHVNGIYPELLLEAQPDPDEYIWPFVLSLAQMSDAIIAHNAEFDKQFVPEDVRSAAPWICSMNDLEFERGKLGSSLLALAAAHKVPIGAAHRAGADVDLLARLLERVAEKHSLEQMFLEGLRPKKRYVAQVSFAEKDLAKQCGFAWQKETKSWWRNIVPEKVESMNLPFEVRQIDAR